MAQQDVRLEEILNAPSMDLSLFSIAGDNSTLETGDPSGLNILDNAVK